MKSSLSLCLLAVFLLHCGENSERPATTSSTNTSQPTDPTSSNNPTPDPQSEETSNEEEPAPTTIPLCQPGCTSVADCVLSTAPATHDLDNFQCDEGICKYSGCTSDSECQTIGDYVCRDSHNTGIPICERACNTPVDCDLGSAPYDSDNYQCTSGVCIYRGCNSDSECSALGDYGCHDLGADHPFCVPNCSTNTDCDLGLLPYDNDNYECTTEVFCQYTGCNSDQECDSYMDGYLCR